MPRKTDFEPLETALEAPVEAAIEALPGAERGLFTLKPSAWYVALEGWSTWLAAAAAVAAAVAASYFTDWISPTARGIVLQFGPAAILLRLVYDSFRWAGCGFLLTDRRAVAQRGAAQPEITQVALDEVDEVELKRSFLQRLTGTGSLLFRVEGVRVPVLMWEHVSDPAEVREAVQAAVARAKRSRFR